MKISILSAVLSSTVNIGLAIVKVRGYVDSAVAAVRRAVDNALARLKAGINEEIDKAQRKLNAEAYAVVKEHLPRLDEITAERAALCAVFESQSRELREQFLADCDKLTAEYTALTSSEAAVDRATRRRLLREESAALNAKRPN